MVFKHPLPVLSLCSLVLGAALFTLAFVAPPSSSGSAPAEGYAGPLFAVLELDEMVSDRETAVALNRALNLEAAGREVLSESSQWVLLNDFDKIVRVPLDQYGDRLETFDPRNDGFAGRLRSFFVRNGKRYFFIPLGDSSPLFGGIFRRAAYRPMENKIRELVGDLPHVLSFPGEASLRSSPAHPSAVKRGVSLYLACYLLAAAAFCFLFRPRRLAFQLVLPLAGLSLLGSPGFAMGAILCLLAGLLLEPAREICFSLRPAGSFRRKEVLAGIRRNGLIPYRSRWFLGLPLTGIYVLSAVLGRAGPLLGAGSFAVFIGVFFSYLTAEARGRGGHIPFVPVIILENRAGPEFPKGILPFACASLVLALFSLSSLNFSPPPILARLDETRPLPDTGSSENWPPPISAAEYEAHVQFQTGFSLLPLGGEFVEPEYFHYDIGQDGLITGVSAEPRGMEEDIPPFSLEGFMTFLENQVYMKVDAGRGSLSLAGFFPALCALVVCIPAFTGPVRRGGGKRKPSLYNDKRIAA
ncbi:MAG: hypothetical protein LBL70_03855 [Treponema sp.]|jgi:hypothetical protein|nr:hypothetical protein [Treponema sp.]